MNLPDIRTLVPHAGPMVLLNRLVAVDDESLCAEVSIGADTLFCEAGRVGAWVGVEYMAQAIAAHAGHAAGLRGEPVKIGFLLGSRRYECSCSGFALGTVLHVHVQRVLQGDNGLGAFDCRIDEVRGDMDVTGESVPLAKATITVFQPDNVVEFLNGSHEGEQ